MIPTNPAGECETPYTLARALAECPRDTYTNESLATAVRWGDATPMFGAYPYLRVSLNGLPEVFEGQPAELFTALPVPAITGPPTAADVPADWQDVTAIGTYDPDRVLIPVAVTTIPNTGLWVKVAVTAPNGCVLSAAWFFPPISGEDAGTEQTIYYLDPADHGTDPAAISVPPLPATIDGPAPTPFDWSADRAAFTLQWSIAGNTGGPVTYDTHDDGGDPVYADLQEFVDALNDFFEAAGTGSTYQPLVRVNADGDSIELFIKNAATRTGDFLTVTDSQTGAGFTKIVDDGTVTIDSSPDGSQGIGGFDAVCPAGPEYLQVGPACGQEGVPVIVVADGELPMMVAAERVTDAHDPQPFSSIESVTFLAIAGAPTIDTGNGPQALPLGVPVPYDAGRGRVLRTITLGTADGDDVFVWATTPDH